MPTTFDPQPVTSASSSGFSITADVRTADPFTASNNTWTEVENSTANDWGGFYITAYQSTAARGILLVATGAASSEVIIATVPVSFGNIYSSMSVFVPVPILSGTRVAVACAAATTLTVQGQIVGVPTSAFGVVPNFTVMDCGPFDLSNDSAAYASTPTIDPGGTANTKGSYTEISESGTNSGNNVLQGDSLANDYDYFGIAIGDNYNTISQVMHKLFDIATGAASSEVIFIPDLHVFTTGREVTTHTDTIFWDPAGAASGTRFSARMQCDLTDADDRLSNVILFGLR